MLYLCGMNNTNTHQQEVFELAKSKDFRSLCAKYAPKMGITPKQWNETKNGLILIWASEMLSK
jgi:hypothetical protein